MGAMCTLFLIVGQHRDISLSKNELFFGPPSLIDEYGCLMKGNESVLDDWLREEDHHAVDPDVVIVDGQHLLYHIVWPFEGSVMNLAKSIKSRLSCYYTEVYVVSIGMMNIHPKIMRGCVVQEKAQ